MTFYRFLGFGILSLAMVCCVMPQDSKAATLSTTGGQLFGALGVNVGGNLFDVAFLDGSCVTLFGGCNPSNFTFTTPADAALASQALLDQVFIDGSFGNFDSSPELTVGCSITPPAGLASCVAITPYATNGTFVQFSFAMNEESILSGSFLDNVGGMSENINTNTINLTAAVVAIWAPTPVPEPGTALLMGLGLAGLGAGRRTLG